MFFLASFLDLIFLVFSRFYAKKVYFGTPLEASWVQNGTQNPPSGVKIQRNASLALAVSLTDFQHRFRNAPGHHFGGFGIAFGIVLDMVLGPTHALTDAPRMH